MKVETIGERMLVKDNPFLFWFFYSIFVIAGAFCLYMMLSLSPKGFYSLFGILLGIGNIIGGVFMLKRGLSANY